MKHLLAFLILCFISAAQAQWAPIGPFGGPVNVVRIIGEQIFVVGDGGVFASRDRGATWNLLFRVDDRRATQLVVDPTDLSTLYAVFATRFWGELAGYYDGRLFKSSDGGVTWRELVAGLPPNRSIAALAMDPKKPSTLFAALQCAENGVTQSIGSGFYKSVDAGESWALSSGGFNRNDLCGRGIAPDPLIPQLVYAYTEHVAGASFFTHHARSTDGGATWQELNDVNVPSHDLLAHPRSGRRFALANTPGQPSEGCFCGFGTAVVVSDDGSTWKRITDSLPTPDFCQSSVRSFAVAPDSDQTVYVGTGAGLFVTRDLGTTWANLAFSGCLGRPVGVANSIAIDPENSATIFVGASSSGLFTSSDRGSTWNIVRVPQIATTVLQMAIDPTDRNTLYATARDVDVASAVIRSSDGGATWETLTLGLPNGLGLAIAADGTPYVVAYLDSRLTRTSLFTFDGASWRALPLPPFSAELLYQPGLVVADPIDARILYVTAGPTTLFKTTDAGITWQPVFTEAIAGNEIRDLVIDRADPSTLYLLRVHSLLKSDDGGTSWQQLDVPTEFRKIALATSNSSIMYAVDWGAPRLFKSTDGGKTWGVLGALSRYISIDGVVVDPREPNVVYIWSNRNGILRSTDGGRTWTDFNDGLTTAVINQVLADSSGRLFAATVRNGIFSRPTGRRRAVQPSR